MMANEPPPAFGDLVLTFLNISLFVAAGIRRLKLNRTRPKRHHLLTLAKQRRRLTCRAMKGVRRAVIDVGTNSIKLLVADVAERDVRPVWEGSIQTRLGQGFYETHRLQPEPIAQTAEAVA